jgi:hypothetical protein
MLFTWLNLGHAALWALQIPALLAGKAYEGGPLAVSPPLRNGTYYVVTGGSNFAVNQHAFAPVARYAMDITRLNGFGLSAAGLFPSDLSKYAVFGADIVAPCSGEVISAEGRVPNRRPLDPDSSDSRGGNHVVLYCRGHSVHLAHMDIGSVTVAVGDRVAAGHLLGRVGNSGNTMMPHLHISAVRGRHEDFRSAAKQGPVVSVPLLIDGRFLIKGDPFTH